MKSCAPTVIAKERQIAEICELCYTDFMHYRKYRRTALSEMAPWVPGMDLTGVSISDADLNGSPTEGDMIARNPANHNDRWLVAAGYFAANFEEV